MIVGLIDVVVVFFLFKGCSFNEWVGVILEIELGINDLMVVFLIVILIVVFGSVEINLSVGFLLFSFI